MEENFDVFDEYAMKYNMNENMIAYKYNHSYRVVHQAEEICRSLNTDTEERDLASFIALTHDIARFEQWTKFETFKDEKSFDHGQEAVKILFEDGMINKFNVKKSDYDVIKKAIYNHNKYAIEDGLNQRELLHAKIIRDADKLDILYAFSTNRLLELKEDDNEVSEEVKEEFFLHKPITRKYVKSKNDRTIMLMSMVFDLYFDYSKLRVKNEKYIEKMYEYLKHKKIYKEYVDEIKKYLKGVKDE